MKKSVVVLIGIIYIAAIALVSFFGLKAKEYNSVVYASSIEIINEGLMVDEETGERYAVVFADATGKLAYQIEHRVGPDNVSNKEVEYVYNRNNGDGITIDSNGVVSFAEAGSSIRVSLVAKDGSGTTSETITIYAL
jgi:hypothetical protein